MARAVKNIHVCGDKHQRLSEKNFPLVSASNYLLCSHCLDRYADEYQTMPNMSTEFSLMNYEGIPITGGGDTTGFADDLIGVQKEPADESGTVEWLVEEKFSFSNGVL